MVLAAVTLLRRHPAPTDDQIREELAGNLCRCTGYQRIFAAVRGCLPAPRKRLPLKTWLRPFALEAPGNLDAALRLLADEPATCRPFAGGTDLMVLLESGKLAPGRYVSIWGLRELQGITVTPAEVIGSVR